MDDIYYWVLRIWGALTSKKAIVVMTCIAAVVVTVSTVFAAPQGEETEEGPDVFVSMDPPPDSVATGVQSRVTVDPLDQLSIGGVDSPGLLPTSPFYFVKGITRDVRYAFTFGSIDRANLKLRYANEDALAIREMCKRSEFIAAAQECFSYQDNFFNSLAWAVKARKQGGDIEALMLNLMTAHHGHRLVLADALEMVGESQLEALVGAITYTSAPFEQVLQWTNGVDEANEFHAKLRNDFASVAGDAWILIENRLCLQNEQAVALSKAMGDSGTLGAAPVISSVTAERMLEVVPGSKVDITCAASDLSGGSVAYQWTATSGRLEGDSEATVTWMAPDEPGVYVVTVTVANAKGNQSHKSVSLRVGTPEAPVSHGSEGPFWIVEIHAEKDPSGRAAISPPVLGQSWMTSERSVFISSTIRITCEMGGSTEGLAYDWSCDVGSIDGSSDSVVWTAPGHACKAQVSVTVRNGSGTVEQATIGFRVSTCSNCFTW